MTKTKQGQRARETVSPAVEEPTYAVGAVSVSVLEERLSIPDGCSWLAHRFNVCPFGALGWKQGNQFVDSFGEVLTAVKGMIELGASSVLAFDTVSGEFFDFKPLKGGK